MGEPSLFLSAGDPSGDNAAARVVQLLNADNPGLSVFGLGGPKLKQLGQDQLTEGANLAVLGFWEVARRYLFFRKLFHDAIAQIKQRRPNAILLVDYPGFNLRLAKAIKPLGIPIIYYISPQVWAWGKKRVELMRRTIDRMLVILPFELEFFSQHDLNCDFVGHYLLEDIPSEYISSEPPGRKRLALLPGSRKQEIERMLPTMLRAATLFADKHSFDITVAGISDRYDYESAVRRFGPKAQIVYDDARRVVYESDLVLTASGTATLETGIIGRPMVVIYKTGFITYQIARRLVELDNIALVNLVLGKTVVPELIQHEANPERLSEQLSRFVDDSNYYQETHNALKQTPAKLGGAGASARTAEIIAEYL